MKLSVHDDFESSAAIPLRFEAQFTLSSKQNNFQAFEVISTAFVVLSISALILGSIPEFQVPQKTEDGQLVYATATYPT